MTASVAPGGAPAPAPVDPDGLRDGMTELDPARLYERFSRVGLDYGPAFRAITRAWRDGDRALALIDVTGRAEPEDGVLHPVVLDACVQSVGAFTEDEPDPWVPTRLAALTVHDRLPERLWCHARWQRAEGAPEGTLDLDLLAEDGAPLATVRGLLMRAVPRSAFPSGAAGPGRYAAHWQPVPTPGTDAAAPSGSWTVRTVTGELPSKEEQVTVGAESSVPRGLLVRLAPGPAGPEAGAADLAADLAASVLDAVAGFLRDHAAGRPDLVLCTTGATAPRPGTDDPDVRQAPAAGLLRAVLAEYPDVRCVQLDLDPAAPAPEPAELLRLAAQLPGSGHLAVRDGRWYEARLREQAPAAADPLPVRPDGSYLITGGMGALGLATAALLADRGARCLLLVGRTVPAAEPAEVARLRAAGVRVELVAADITDPAAVAALVASTGDELPALRGVVHAAGVQSEVVLEHQDAAELRRIMDPKVRGGWLLHRATAGLELDFFVLYSSIASVFGAAGQAGYVAGNAFLDALAEHRRHHGLPALGVNWGPWQEFGMAATPEILARFAATGIAPLPADEALALLGTLGAAAHTTVVAVDWARFATGPGRAAYTLLADLRPAGADAGSAQGAPDPDRVRELARLAATDPALARETVLSDLLVQTARTLGLTEAEREALRPQFADRRMNELGYDSLTTIQLRNRLQADFGAYAPADFLFSSTGGEITDLVCRQLTALSVLADDGFDDDADTEVLTL